MSKTASEMSITPSQFTSPERYACGQHCTISGTSLPSAIVTAFRCFFVPQSVTDVNALHASNAFCSIFARDIGNVTVVKSSQETNADAPICSSESGKESVCKFVQSNHAPSNATQCAWKHNHFEFTILIKGIEGNFRDTARNAIDGIASPMRIADQNLAISRYQYPIHRLVGQSRVFLRAVRSLALREPFPSRSARFADSASNSVVSVKC